MSKWFFISRIARLFDLSKKNMEEARDTSAPPTPPQPREEKTPPPQPETPEPEPQEIKKKTRKKSAERSKHEPAIDKKGFRVLTNRHDLHRLFGGEEEEKKKGDSDFARMFEESQNDVYQKRLMIDKKQAEHHDPARTPRPPSEKIKTYPPPQKELDLHGYTGAEAEIAAEHFIQDALRKKIQTLRIIVGKGLHSQGEAVLPGIVEKKIIQLKRNNLVLSYHWEKKDKRKSGAIIVYIASGGHAARGPSKGFEKLF
jgi:DNA-nicking Smr family endonuclease